MSEIVTASTLSPGPSDLSLVVVALFKGPLYRDIHEQLWPLLLRLRSRVADHVGVVGLRLEIDESEGYAFLRSLRDDETDVEYPRLVTRHTLGFQTSLLIALLRKRLAEFDATSSDVRLVLSRDQIVEMLRVYLPSAADDVRTVRAVEVHIKKAEELGFLHRLRGQEDQYEVRRIIRAFVDGQWLSDFDERLREYVELAAGDADRDSTVVGASDEEHRGG
jgi:hypothetical protein